MFACIYIPDLPVEAIVRVEPLLRERPVAVLEGKAPLTRVIALNEKARLLGMETGMTMLQATIFAENLSPAGEKEGRSDAGKGKRWKTAGSPDLAVLRQRSPEQENSAHSALLDVAHAFTPRVEDTSPDTLLLDLAGLERLYGAPVRMGNALVSRVTSVGLEANIAIAANPDAAMHAARGFNGITIITTGSEARRLGVLSVQILLDAFEISSPAKCGRNGAERERQKFREQMLDTLERWGVRDFRTLALLPEHALASRLGEAGAHLRRLAQGAGMRTLLLCEPPAEFEEAMELESPVETIESLAFVLNRLLEQLCARLEARALAAQELRLQLQLERRVADEASTTTQELANDTVNSHIVAGKPMFERTLRLPVSMRDSKVFLKLLQLELAAHPPGAPITKVWITAEPAPPRVAQRGLFLPISPEAEKLEITLARINAIVGERRAGIARSLDSHRRESFRVERFAAPADDAKQPGDPASSHPGGSPALAVRLFRPAWRLQVNLSDGRPEALFGAQQGERGELRGKVIWSAGPWRSSGDWWTEKTKPDSAKAEQSGPWDREEWDVAVTSRRDDAAANGDSSGVAFYRIHRDLATGHWFADASYD